MYNLQHQLLPHHLFSTLHNHYQENTVNQVQNTTPAPPPAAIQYAPQPPPGEHCKPGTKYNTCSSFSTFSQCTVYSTHHNHNQEKNCKPGEYEKEEDCKPGA
jgi:hypothetical protein